MAVMTKGTFSIDIGFVKLGADFAEEDRQSAWELYAELATRVALTGKPKDLNCTDFSGEVYVESLASLYAFFGEARKIMRQFPVGATKMNQTEDHLGALIHRFMRDVLRPFLEEWQAEYRYWWEEQSDKSLPPFERQEKYPKIGEMLSQWGDLRAIMRAIQDELARKYRLIDLTKLK